VVELLPSNAKPWVQNPSTAKNLGRIDFQILYAKKGQVRRRNCLREVERIGYVTQGGCLRSSLVASVKWGV
jgi:hypothetical protein